MRTYILKRLLLIFPTLLAITVLSYMMMRVAPGDPVKAGMLGGGASESKDVGIQKTGESEAAKTFKRKFFLDKPWYVGYALWLEGIFGPRGFGPDGFGNCDWKTRLTGCLPRLDFGVSLTVSLSKPVWDLILERLPVTLKLEFWSVAIIYLIAIPAGLYSGVFRNTLPDRAVSIFFFFLYSLPSFWVGLLLIIAASAWLPGWPTQGLDNTLPLSASYWQILLDTAKHYVLPVFCLSFGAFAGLSRFARVGLLEVIRQDYIRTARAKGLSEWQVILKHALRNSLIPLVTIFAGLLPGLIGGSVLIEFLFNINGMGLLGFDALGKRDYPVLITIFGFGAFLTLVGILISDILYAVVDPRITFD